MKKPKIKPYIETKEIVIARQEYNDELKTYWHLIAFLIVCFIFVKDISLYLFYRLGVLIIFTIVVGNSLRKRFKNKLYLEIRKANP